MAEEKSKNIIKPIEKKVTEFTEQRNFPTVVINVSMPKVEKPKETKTTTSNTNNTKEQDKK